MCLAAKPSVHTTHLITFKTASKRRAGYSLRFRTVRTDVSHTPTPVVRATNRSLFSNKYFGKIVRPGNKVPGYSFRLVINIGLMVRALTWRVAITGRVDTDFQFNPPNYHFRSRSLISLRWAHSRDLDHPGKCNDTPCARDT